MEVPRAPAAGSAIKEAGIGVYTLYEVPNPACPSSVHGERPFFIADHHTNDFTIQVYSDTNASGFPGEVLGCLPDPRNSTPGAMHSLQAWTLRATSRNFGDEMPESVGVLDLVGDLVGKRPTNPIW